MNNKETFNNVRKKTISENTMGFFRKKQQPTQAPLPPVPRYTIPSGEGQNMPSAYAPTFSQQPRPAGPQFPDLSHEEQQGFAPSAPSFPRPLQEPKPVASPPVYTRALDERLPSQQQPFTRPVATPQPRPEPIRVQMPPPPLSREPAQEHRPSVEIPVREPAFLRKPAQYPDRAAVANEEQLPFQRAPMPKPVIPDRPLRQPVSFHRESPPEQIQTMTVEDKPLFIKIGQYREAMAHLELLKQKIKDAETALAKMEELRTKEQTELANAHTLLATVKEKLLAIDKQLFEV